MKRIWFTLNEVSRQLDRLASVATPAWERIYDNWDFRMDNEEGYDEEKPCHTCAWIQTVMSGGGVWFSITSVAIPDDVGFGLDVSLVDWDRGHADRSDITCRIHDEFAERIEPKWKPTKRKEKRKCHQRKARPRRSRYPGRVRR